jgi:hypothetical protein
MGGSACSHRVTPACSERIPRVLSILEVVQRMSRPGRPRSSSCKRHEGQGARRRVAGYRGGETSESMHPKGVTGMKQDRRGRERSNASRG